MSALWVLVLSPYLCGTVMTYPGAQRSYPLNDPPPEMMPHDPDMGNSGPPKPTILGLVDGHWWRRKKKVKLPHDWHGDPEKESVCCFCGLTRMMRSVRPPDPGHGRYAQGRNTVLEYWYWDASRSDPDPKVCRGRR